MNGSKVLVVGVAYKQDIDDYRESPALKVIEKLQETGAEVEYYDPWVSEYRYKGETYHSISKIDENIVAGYDIVMITAAHSNVDYDMIQRGAKAVFDTKNVMKNVKTRDNIEIL